MNTVLEDPFPRSLQKIEAVHDVILKDQRIGVERTADTLNVSYLFDVVHRHLVRKNYVSSGSANARMLTQRQ